KNDRSISARLAFTGPRNSLLDNTPTIIGIDQTFLSILDPFDQFASVMRSFRAYRTNHLLLKIRIPRPAELVTHHAYYVVFSTTLARACLAANNRPVFHRPQPLRWKGA